jgi:TRAP-type mannitol/chloroaromatic compound transport system substrate-binding protein
MASSISLQQNGRIGMKRREFLKSTSTAAGAAVVGAVAASSFPKPAISQGLRELKMVTTWPKNFPGLGTGAERLAQRITKGTGGKLSVKVFAGGELVPPLESQDAVTGGTADLYHAAEYYWQGKSKAFNFFAAVPFGLTATEMDAWIHHGGGQEIWDELGAEFNLKPFAAGNTGVQMGGWFNKEINSLEDYKGLKIRMPGLGGEVLRRIGAAAVNLPGGEIFQALQSGNIDATEWVGPWNDLAFGFYKIAKFYYYPGFHEPGTTLSAGINKKVWDGLSSDHKAIIESAMAAENNFTLAEFNTRNNTSLKTLVSQHGVQVRRFSNDVMNAIGEVSGEVVAEAAGSDAITKKVYDSFIAFRRNAIAWSKLSDQAYWNARLLPFKYDRV